MPSTDHNKTWQVIDRRITKAISLLTIFVKDLGSRYKLAWRGNLCEESFGIQNWDGRVKKWIYLNYTVGGDYDVFDGLIERP